MPQHTVSPAGPTRTHRGRSALAAPRPVPRPLERSLFGETAPVPYRWLRDARSP